MAMAFIFLPLSKLRTLITMGELGLFFALFFLNVLFFLSSKSSTFLTNLSILVKFLCARRKVLRNLCVGESFELFEFEECDNFLFLRVLKNRFLKVKRFLAYIIYNYIKFSKKLYNKK